MDPTRVLDALLRERPSFHTDVLAPEERRAPGVYDWSIGEDVLRWLCTALEPGARTLETGCGYSTVVFAAAGCRHTAISPDRIEHDAVRDWCRRHDVTADLELVAACSQDVLPRLVPEPLDLILIDGDHAFPAPFIDWYYTAEGLRPGGTLLVDDTQIPTGAVLRDFLLREKGRWLHERDFGKTAVFRRVTDGPVVRGLWWGQQPWCAEPVPSPTPMRRLGAGMRGVLGRR
jgi:predicted O-methyltransferase YrrM